MAKTYNPLPSWPPAVIAGLVLLGGYVIGPAVGLVLHRLANAVDVNLAEFPTEGEAP